jgi:hypothetical protein
MAEQMQDEMEWLRDVYRELEARDPDHATRIIGIDGDVVEVPVFVAVGQDTMVPGNQQNVVNSSDVMKVMNTWKYRRRNRLWEFADTDSGGGAVVFTQYDEDHFELTLKVVDSVGCTEEGERLDLWDLNDFNLGFVFEENPIPVPELMAWLHEGSYSFMDDVVVTAEEILFAFEEHLVDHPITIGKYAGGYSTSYVLRGLANDEYAAEFDKWVRACLADGRLKPVDD